MANLHELSSEIAAIVAWADENGGELPFDVEERLGQLGGDIESKLEALNRWRRQMEDERSAIDAEAKRVYAFGDRVERKLSWLKRYMKTGMDQAGIRKVGGLTWGVTICNNSQPSVNVSPDVAIDELPATLRIEKRTVDVDRKAVVAAAARGEDLPAGITVSRGDHLRFK